MDYMLGPLRKKFKELFGVDIGTQFLKESFSDYLQDLSKNIVTHASDRLNISNDNLNSRLSFQEIDSPVVNGYIDIDNNSKKCTIYLTKALMIFLHKISKILCSTICIGEPGNIVEPSPINESKMISLAKSLLVSFWEKDIWRSKILPEHNLSKIQIIVSGMLLINGETFVIAHELGHLILESENKVSTELLVASKGMETRIKQYLSSIGVSSSKIEIALKRWPKEFVSDLIGMQLCLKNAEDSFSKMIIRSSVEFVLLVKKMLEDYYYKAYRINYHENLYRNTYSQNNREMDHPPTNWRWDFIHNYPISSDPIDNQTDLSDALKYVIEGIIDRI